MTVQNTHYIKKPLFSRKTRHFLGQALAHFVMISLSIIFMIPIIWMLSTSLKGRWEIFAWPPQWIPETLHWENYTDAFTKYPLGRYMLNSSFLVAANIAGEMISVPLVAYGFARLRFPGKRILFVMMLATMMIPGHIKLIPLFAVYNKLGMIDTYWPLILPAFFGNPFLIFLMTQYMKTIPFDLDEAARIDGAGTWGILYRVILPLCKPPLTILAVYTFLWTWNEFLHPLIYLNDFDSFPIQVGLAFFKGRYGVEWNLFMAATLISIAPILILYFFLQKQLIGGISSVGLKG